MHAKTISMPALALFTLATLSTLTPAQRAVLERVIGDPEARLADVDAVRQVVVETGAVADVERRVATLRAEAEQAIDGLADPARSALLELAAVAVDRSA